MTTLKMFVGVAVVVAMIVVGVKVIPVYFDNYQLEDAIKTEALQSTYSTRTPDDIRDAIIKRAHDCDIPLTAKQVHVSRTGYNGTGSLIIEVNYTATIDLPGYSTTIEFSPSTKNKGVF
jgi:hypothetical protein